MYTTKISVRNLVEFILRSGDITTSGTSLRDPESMQEGTRIHQMLQRRMGSGYRSEVSLSLDIPVTIDSLDFTIKLEGRADGIFSDSTGVVIDEIKGVYRDIFLMKEPVPVHLAQALCYAYLYAKKKSLKEIGVRISYCHIPSEKVRYFTEHRSFGELEEWFLDLIYEYGKWCAWQINWQKKRNKSIRKTEFPFSYRPGQSELVKGVYLSILRKKRLYIEAPTGVGKTISTVFPAVKSIGEKITEKIFYLTAKTITRTVAEEAFSLLEEKGTLLKYATITAKEKICILSKPVCHPDTCPRAKGHFDRVNDAMFDVLTQENKINRDTIIAYADKHNVCPFEFSLDLCLWSDVIIGDYNYAFDPTACLKRFFASETENSFIFLIDEAHNLVDRAREMYSALLVKEDFLKMQEMMKRKSKKITSALMDCNRAMLELKYECDTSTTYQLVQLDRLLIHLVRLNTLLEEVLHNTAETNLSDDALFLPLSLKEKEELLTFYFVIREFLNIYELFDSHYIIYGDYNETGDFRLHLQCMDPSKNLNNYLKKVRASIFFSATFLPIRYYKEQLAGRKDDYAVYAPSPFSEKNRLIMIGKGISTKYTKRSPKMYQKIVSYILSFVSERTGNYLVFFPSYQMLYTIEDYLETAVIERRKQAAGNDSCRVPQILAQKTMMSEEERETFLSQFQPNPDRTTIGLCVMGGIFGEGIDLKNDRLIGAVLVGTGLPMICTENELFRNYFQKKKKDGFSYAYQIPGMNKVLQAGGRVIRTTEDTGAVLLLDDRFLQTSYQKLFPREWFPYETVTEQTIANTLARFWKEKQER